MIGGGGGGREEEDGQLGKVSVAVRKKKEAGPAVGIGSENSQITLQELTSNRCAVTYHQQGEFTHQLSTTDQSQVCSHLSATS